ncbi:fungal-specific transcription factor domain-containing protein [Phaeosphaeria sp. MPI-PUGE-AT-0046c]|nr:fungal-specific transcription factor domain-containing protein [Phaeosphaeria sp. MPI-PUGE-AT-0046c]
MAEQRGPPEHGGPRAKGFRQPPSHRKSRGLTCGTCRFRKVRCDGSQPRCRMCELHNEECRYDKAPPMSQLVAMAKRLQEAEQALAEMKADGERALSETATPHAQTTELMDNAEQPSPSNPIRDRARAPLEQVIDTISVPGHDQPSPSIRIWGGPITAASQAAPSTQKNAAATELTVDEHGSVRYYGPTSAVHEPSPMIPDADSPHDIVQRADARSSLALHARESNIWEEFAIGNAAVQTGVPRQIIAKLLHIHWTWVGPMFLWIHRSAFIHDMATGGRHYSEFLLTVICAHAGKYEDAKSAEILSTRARSLLGSAIQERSSVPTIQALLQLSAMELAQGSISQAWVYSGIAFRMASDLGLQHVSIQIKGLSLIDLEVRRRLYWSCYFWDKATSLYTGRLPSVTEVVDPSSLDLLDTSADSDLWSPYFADSLNLTNHALSQYPPTQSYNVTAFINSCKLSIIIHDIITTLYYRRGKTVTETAFTDIQTSLENWRIRSPRHVKIDTDNLPTVCPPPHLISQNMLYFASVILTNRPFWTVPQYYNICIEASKAIEKLVVLLESTFSLDNITYLMGYCIYTGASVSLEDAKKTSNAEHPTLKTFLRALNCGMKRCRLLERSLNIIIKEMSRSFYASSLPGYEVANNELATAPSGYIPAFPYIDPIGTGEEIDFDWYFSGANTDSMNLLDCFPETQMDWSGMLGMN